MHPAETPWLDIAWIVLCAALVLIMQAGFTCLESGLARSKNSISVAMKNFVDFCVSSALFWLFGYALMFGASWGGLCGTSGWLFHSESPRATAFFLFQLVFCGTATTIVSGAVAERMRFWGYFAVSALVSALIYPLVGHWVWGGADLGVRAGWLAQRGFIDFAGSTVVHSVGGWVALAAVLTLGPRLGRFSRTSPDIRGHNLPLTTLGAFLLWFGWVGFNGGSTLAVNGSVPQIVVNTCLSAAFGGLTALGLSVGIVRRPDVTYTINGALAGLVGITASAHIVSPLASAVIGTIAAGICVAATLLLEKLHIDDAVGAVPVHAFAGVWGTLAVALFAEPAAWGTGLSRWQQLGVQATGAGACFAITFGGAYVLLWPLHRIWSLRVTHTQERVGLNVAEHGASTELLDLLHEMGAQQQCGDFSRRVTVEPHTEVGEIAEQYNRVLDRVNDEIEKQRQIEAALRAAEERYRGIFENSFEGMYLASNDGRFLLANPALARLLGYDSVEHLLAEVRDLGQQMYVEPDRRREFDEAARATNTVSGFVSQVRCRSGELKWISENARGVTDERGELQYYEGIVIDITERRRAELDRRDLQQRLVNAARQDGMAEIATGVLHNVGNALNSVNVSTTLLADKLRGSKLHELSRGVGLLLEHRDGLATFLGEDERGRQLPGFLALVTQHLERERSALLDELESLVKNLDHIKTIVAMQQSYAGHAGLVEPVRLDQLCEDALKLNSSHLEGDQIEIVREFTELPEMPIEKQKLLQILVNLIQNAKDSLAEASPDQPRLTLRTVQDAAGLVRIEIGDNGVGIADEDLTRVFSHGFTTKPHGHGFGLHCSANAAAEIGASLRVESDGPGRGATFTLELPNAAAEVLA